MFDHFGFLAPFYERMVPAPDATRLGSLLRLPAKGRLLDAGGGTGRVTAQLHQLVDEIILTDASAGMLKQARLKGKLLLSQCHSERLPFADESFDRILVVDALHHFSDQRKALGELVRVLRSGGRLVVEEPDLNHFRVKVVALVEKLALMRSHFHYPDEIQKMLSDQGLLTRIERDEQITAWVIADRR